MKPKSKPGKKSHAPVIASPAPTQLTDSEAEIINRQHEEIEGSDIDNLKKAYDNGRRLEEKKNKLGHGSYLPWLEQNIRFSERTANRYVLVWRNKDRLAKLGINGLSEAYHQIALWQNIVAVTKSQSAEAAAKSDSLADLNPMPSGENPPPQWFYEVMVLVKMLDGTNWKSKRQQILNLIQKEWSEKGYSATADFAPEAHIV
jgi:hypothetical protein